MILVTGATGFLGAELVLQLTASGQKVRALKRETSKIPAILAKNPLIEWALADLNEPETLADAFEDVSQVYHCAAFISFEPKDKKKLFKINIQGTSNLVNLCLENKTRLVHVSSVAALGNGKKGQDITENDYWKFDESAHNYAISKHEGEMEVWRGIAEGLNAVVVNPSIILGKNAGFEGSGAIFKLVKDGLKFYTDGAGGFVDVEDVAKAMVLLMNKKISGERFILSAENIHYKDLFAIIAKNFNLKAPGIEAKPWMLAVAWRTAKLVSFFTGKAPSLTKDTAKSSFSLSYYSNQKIKSAIYLSFKPLKASIEQICAALQ